MFPFGVRLMELLKIDIFPTASINYFYNIIKRFKDQHHADESVSISSAQVGKNKFSIRVDLLH